MLEEKLNPILSQLRIEERDRKANFKIVKTWFQKHEENLAENLNDLAYVCTLPNKERTLLTYPVIGNWFLDKMTQFVPSTTHQEQMLTQLRWLVAENRFNNHHTKSLYSNPEKFNKKCDELNSLMLINPNDTVPLNELMKEISREIGNAVYYDEFPKNYVYTIDLGHGLSSPADSFDFLTYNFDSLKEADLLEPLNLTIMVIDDQKPKEWYQRMIAVGFKHQEEQMGFFFDCESALKALGTGHYDVILTDLELGEGKMTGLDFVRLAYEIQKNKGIKPRISVFSYNQKLLNSIEEEIGCFSRQKEKLLFQQVNRSNNKSSFTAIEFRHDVSWKLKYH